MMQATFRSGGFGLVFLLWLGAVAGASPASAQCTLRWQALATATQPPQRERQAMAFDSQRGVTVLFGGITIKGFNGISVPSDVFGDTWEFDGKTWTQRFPATPPLPLEYQSMSYDSGRGVTVMFGGLVGTNLNGVDFPSSSVTWEWDGSNWIDVHPSGGVAPLGRAGANMVYDSARGVHVLYGGQAPNGSTLNDTWEYDGSAHAWTLRATNGLPSRGGTALAYDSAHNQTVLFGGVTSGGASGYLNDTWIWNGQAGTWSSPVPAHKPPGRLFHLMAFDSTRSMVVLQGGEVVTADYGTSWQTGYSSSTWEWNGTDWTDRSSAYNFCCALPLSFMVYESARQQMIVYDAAGNNISNLMMTTWALATGGSQSVTYADVANNGPADGSQAHPYPKVQQAAACAIGGSAVSIKAGNYPEGYSFYNKQLTFTATGGQVQLH